MKFWEKWKTQSWFPYTVAACVGVTLYMILNNLKTLVNFFTALWTLVKPLLYGLVLAYLIDPIARFYENKPFSKIKKDSPRRGISVVFALITVVIVFVGLGAAVIPSLIRSLTNIFATFSEFVNSIDGNAGHFTANLPFGLGETLANFSVSDTLLDKLSGFLTDNIESIANTSVTIGSGFVNFIIAFILAVYYMLDKERIKKLAKSLLIIILREKRFAYFEDFYKRVDSILLQYIKGNVLEAFLVGAANAVFMLVGGLPYVLLISIVVGITNMAPTFGPIVGAVIGGIMLVMVNPWYALAFVIFSVVLQTIDGYILKPKLFGETLGVSPLLILIFIILGGRLWGVIGILLGIPFAAIAQYAVDDLWSRHKERVAARESENGGVQNDKDE